MVFANHRRRIWVRAGYLLALVALAPVLAWNSVTQQFNAALSDVLFRLGSRPRSQARDGIVLLAIDDATVARYGPLPLRRDTLAAALRQLAGFHPRAVAVDILLSEPGPPSADVALSNALGLFPRRILGAAMEAGAARWILPIPPLAAGASLAHVHAEPDADGVVRSILPAKAAGGSRYWALGLQLARSMRALPEPVESPKSVRIGNIRLPGPAGRPLLIHFIGPEGAFTRVSFGDLLAGRARGELFRDKAVIVGVTAQGGGDRLFTPVSSGIGMSGIEIHANVARTILDQAFLVPPVLDTEILGYAMIAALCMAASMRWRGARLALALGAIALSIPAACAAAFQVGDLWPLGSLLAFYSTAAAVTGTGEYALVALALRESEARRRDYGFRVQAIVHEIKTPLTAIQGSSELIAEPALAAEDKPVLAGLIFKESKRLTTLIRMFLDVERISSGAVPLKTEQIGLAPLCAEVLESARLYARRKQTVIEADLSDAMVEGDPELLSFAVYNLLTNAVKYSPKRTTVRLRLRSDGKIVAITVADQGYGIEPAEQHRVFERYYRAERDRKAGEEGSGIGLALVKEIVEQHGGRVTLESRPGAGSRFTIELPKWNQ